MNSKVVQRLLTFFIGIPLVLGLIFFDPSKYHYGINIAVSICSIIAAAEMHDLLLKKTPLNEKIFLCALTFIQPAISFLLVFCGKNQNYSYWVFLLSAMVILVVEAFSQKTFEASMGRITSSIFVIFYCGFLFTFFSKMTLFKEASILIALFLFSVFINDSFAWFFGVLFGKNNRGIFAASPNKSIAGFAGGYAAAIASNVFAQILWPELLSGSLVKGVILGILCSTAANAGDLIESVFKRSADVKDSGNLIPGRGGILDSIDSVLFTAPVYYIFVNILYHPESVCF